MLKNALWVAGALAAVLAAVWVSDTLKLGTPPAAAATSRAAAEQQLLEESMARSSTVAQPQSGIPD